MTSANLNASADGREIDPGEYRMGVVYAKALIGAAEKAGRTDEVLDELDTLVDGVLARHPQIAEALASGVIPNEDKAAMVDRVLAGRVSPLFLSFVKVVAAHGRAAFFRVIRQAAHDLVDQLRSRVRVQVTTAAAIDDEATRRITHQLRRLLAAEPVVARVVNPDLIGGVVFRIGDTVYDGSVSTRLEWVRTQMIHRSVHEIQRRRDRFGSPAGN